MDRLWAPWRLKYILEDIALGNNKACIFCFYPQNVHEKDRENLVLFRSGLSFIIMNRYPYNTGHIMVAPYRHVACFQELTKQELEDISVLVKAGINAVKETLDPGGFNIGINQGKIAGAGYEEHIHVHIVPRWNGDTNFMPVISDTKVLPESLLDTYDKIKERLSARG
ncbi:MAG: HIT domain-containing protein [Deltaproteobacteria bacterium]|nr:HIT domain-containing protein [Deltaproteobacteria bacterium]MCL5277531.1 HIT domain-containing protein [Deltaproteobacteria bacterium]